MVINPNNMNYNIGLNINLILVFHYSIDKV
jgi:hypothetical protein